LFVILVASIALPLAAVAFNGVWNVVNEERARASEALRLQAHTFAALLDRHIADSDALLTGLSAAASLWTSGDIGRISDVLRAVDLPAGDILAIASADGTVLLNTLPPRPGQALAPSRSDEMLQLLHNRTAGVTNLYRGPTTGVFRLAIVRPIAWPTMPADTLYSIIYSMPASRLVESLFVGIFPTGLTIEVGDRHGTVVAASQRLENRIGHPVNPALLAETGKAESGLFRVPDGAGVPGIIAFAHSRATGFTVLVEASDAALSPSVREHVGRMLIATALLCLPGIVLIFSSARRLTAGLGLLTEISSGNVNRLRLSAIREIDAAAAVLVSATTAEAAARERLRMLNTSLESRVEQAVADLELARERTMHARQLETLGSLASGMAHDFGNVLQVIDGYASLIHENLDQNLAVERWTVMLEAEVKRGMAVIQRLMSYGRKEALQATAADVALLVGGVAEILRHTLSRRMSVVVDIPAGLPKIWADKAQLETVLMNFGTNARDAMGDGGTLTLAAALIEADDGSKTGYIRIDAADNGAGMPADILARASEPFFTTKEVGKGTGLGLATARDFAEKSGGRMTIVSEPGLGTTVSLFIPVAVPVAPPSATPASETSIKVLLIDDAAGVRDVIARALRRNGFTVEVEAAGQPALARVAAGEKLDIVVTDYGLDGIQGDEIIRRLHGLRPGLPIILLTGDVTAAEEFLDGYEFGRYVRLISKPVSGLDLAEAVQMVLGDSGEGRP
jgi:signal transduction histidine kinase/CheY-like chemotaxis protein